MSADMPASSLDRRGFLRAAGSVASATVLGMFAKKAVASQQEPVEFDPPVGVHIAAHSFYDEGIEHCLDFLQEYRGVVEQRTIEAIV